MPSRCHRSRHLLEARPALLEFLPPRCSLALDRYPNCTLDFRLVDLRQHLRALELFIFPLQLSDSLARLVKTSDFCLYFMWQVSKLAQYVANRLGWRGRRKQMSLARARVGGPDLCLSENERHQAD